MRNVLIVILILIIGLGGFLGWDWYDKTTKQQLEPSITLYFWTDAKGNKHFSDAPPPRDARDVYTDKGYKHIKRPLVVMIKEKVIEFYKETKKKLFKPKEKRKKKK